MADKIMVIGLNEINFGYIEAYAKDGQLPFLKTLLEKNKLIETESEKEYHLLEPWIQWVTVQTGLNYEEHKVFRLGDITQRKDLKQLFEKVEEKGKKVGVVSPFNADNRLRQPSFFVPDPWTKTNASGSSLLQNLSHAVSQMVNENANSGFSFKSIVSILLALLVYVPFSRYGHYFKLVLNRKKPGFKATILDSLLSDVFIHLVKNKKPDFSWLFLNSGAHIQHHYLFNSSVYDGDLKNPEWYCPASHDPLLHILKEYDKILERVHQLNYKLIIITGLHQQPHNHMTFYWRLKEHAAFMKKIGVTNHTRLLPRMSRDFLVEFTNEQEAASAEQALNGYRAASDNMAMFAVDNRGTSLFVELVYPNNIDDNFDIVSGEGTIISNFKQYVAFVAIKNGEHNGTGYVLSNMDLKLNPRIKLKELHHKLLEIA